ncbi:hypothetical protein NP493_817g02019 [Ridgeia piscesae]|uniref:Uncharacterized protein n=1 Tax=Ridgeia piscesae TaxID=27915 RepID=A0AAD9NLB4_RIDPI|nr:hypothetical protein NP493_817g02019 [Ridgeia piscesae]
MPLSAAATKSFNITTTSPMYKVKFATSYGTSRLKYNCSFSPMACHAIVFPFILTIQDLKTKPGVAKSILTSSHRWRNNSASPQMQCTYIKIAYIQKFNVGSSAKQFHKLSEYMEFITTTHCNLFGDIIGLTHLLARVNLSE